MQIDAIQKLCQRLHSACRDEDNLSVIAGLGQVLAEAIVMTSTDQSKQGTIQSARRVAEHIVQSVSDVWEHRKQSAN